MEQILTSEGFSCTVTDGGLVKNFTFRRNAGDRTEMIKLPRRAYSTGLNTYIMKFETPWASIAFDEVEQVLAEALGFSQEDLDTIHQRLFPDTENLAVPGVTKEGRMFLVNSEAEERSFTGYFKQFYETGARHFFERFTTLKAVDEHLSILPVNKMQKFVTDAGGNSALHRIVAIKFLSHNSGALEFYRESKKDLFENRDGGVVTQMYDRLLKVADKLEIKE